MSINKLHQLSANELKAFQETELQKLLIYLQQHSPFYKKLFVSKSIDINQIKTIEDLQKIPFTTKEDNQ